MTKLATTEQLTRLEMLFSEQEHTLQSLNDIVVQQTRQISILSSDLELIKQQYRDLKSDLPGGFDDIEKPPHY